MQVAYRLSASELDGSFVASIKALFKDKNIEIVIYDEDEEEEKLGAILKESAKETASVSEEVFLKALHER